MKLQLCQAYSGHMTGNSFIFILAAGEMCKISIGPGVANLNLQTCKIYRACFNVSQSDLNLLLYIWGSHVFVHNCWALQLVILEEKKSSF